MKPFAISFVSDRQVVNFVPRETGTHYVHVRLNGVHVPGSPYKVQVGQVDADASRVRAYGDGLQKGTTGKNRSAKVSSAEFM